MACSSVSRHQAQFIQDVRVSRQAAEPQEVRLKHMEDNEAMRSEPGLRDDVITPLLPASFHCGAKRERRKLICFLSTSFEQLQ